jgi:hypothetical protein
MPEVAQKIAYSAIVLDEKSRTKLINTFKSVIPNNDQWIPKATHMTISNSEIPKHLEKYLSFPVKLKIISLGISDKVVAVGVQGFESEKDIPHVTIFINSSKGGVSNDSNKIINWKSISTNFFLIGKVQELPVKL